MIMRTDRFKGNLLDMIGKTAAKAVEGLAYPMRVVDGGGYERLLWEDEVEDGEDGRRHVVRFTAKLFRGRVTEVGIQSRDFIFILEDEGGGPFFAAVAKGDDFGAEDLNWIGLEEGVFSNKGVE